MFCQFEKFMRLRTLKHPKRRALKDYLNDNALSPCKKTRAN